MSWCSPIFRLFFVCMQRYDMSWHSHISGSCVFVINWYVLTQPHISFLYIFVEMICPDAATYQVLVFLVCLWLSDMSWHNHSSASCDFVLKWYVLGPPHIKFLWVCVVVLCLDSHTYCSCVLVMKWYVLTQPHIIFLCFWDEMICPDTATYQVLVSLCCVMVIVFVMKIYVLTQPHIGFLYIWVIMICPDVATQQFFVFLCFYNMPWLSHISSFLFFFCVFVAKRYVLIQPHIRFCCFLCWRLMDVSWFSNTSRSCKFIKK